MNVCDAKESSAECTIVSRHAYGINCELRRYKSPGIKTILEDRGIIVVKVNVFFAGPGYSRNNEGIYVVYMYTQSNCTIIRLDED